MRERWACKDHMGYVEKRGKTGIPSGARDFTVRDMYIINGETCDVSRTQLYVVLPL